MARNEKMSAVLDLRGLDMVTPVDLLSNGRTPYAKNFRLYAQQTDDRRVAVSSRKGPSEYTKPLNEVISSENTSPVTGEAHVGIIESVQIIKVEQGFANPITGVDLHVGNPNGAAGPLKVELYGDTSGQPGKLLAQSSILNGDIPTTADWRTARFIGPPTVPATEAFWIVIRIQDDGRGKYSLSTSDTGAQSYTTSSALQAMDLSPSHTLYRVRTAPAGRDKGAFRFARDNGQNKTLVAYGESMYTVNDATGTLTELINGLSPLATDYTFAHGDNKVFWVNGFDELTAWDGTNELLAPNVVSNPEFELNTTGWVADSGTTIARSTADKHSGAASLSATASTGKRSVSQTVSWRKNQRMKISFWAKGASASGDFQFAINGNSTPVQSSITPVTGDWQLVEFYWTPGDNITKFSIQSTSVNFFLDDVNIIHTGIEYIRDDNLPILSQVIMHRDRLWGVDATDPNKLLFSENPGNPAYNPAGTVPTTKYEQWYYEWMSTSFIYVPRPHNGSPVTALVSFQDSLTVFTQDNKYVISGYDRGSLSMRQSTGNKGAISSRGVASDENRIYFVADDGLYEHNGSSDEKVSALANPLYDASPRKGDITPVIWSNQVRFYMPSLTSNVNDICLIYDKDMKELLMDTDTFVNRAITYTDADDEGQLVEFNSVVQMATFGESQYNALGAPIDFEYRLKYDSMGSPMQRKRLRRFYPILQGVDSTFVLELAMDKDFEDSPRVKEQLMATNGAKWGEFAFGDGTLFGSSTSFKPKRQSYSGYAHYWQLRVRRNGINNRVAFVGAQFSYKTKRL